jgi:hypothetical protein
VLVAAALEQLVLLEVVGLGDDEEDLRLVDLRVRLLLAG